MSAFRDPSARAGLRRYRLRQTSRANVWKAGGATLEDYLRAQAVAEAESKPVGCAEGFHAECKAWLDLQGRYLSGALSPTDLAKHGLDRPKPPLNLKFKSVVSRKAKNPIAQVFEYILRVFKGRYHRRDEAILDRFRSCEARGDVDHPVVFHSQSPLFGDSDPIMGCRGDETRAGVRPAGPGDAARKCPAHRLTAVPPPHKWGGPKNGGAL